MSRRCLVVGLVVAIVVALSQAVCSFGQTADAAPEVGSAEARRLFMAGSGGPGTARAPEYLKPAFERYVFEGEAFPKFDYPEPERIRALVGSYGVAAEFYNSRHEKVTVANEPGRHFAVVTVTSAAGDSFTLYKLLFRLPHVNDLRRAGADETHYELKVAEDADAGVQETPDRISRGEATGRHMVKGAAVTINGRPGIAVSSIVKE